MASENIVKIGKLARDFTQTKIHWDEFKERFQVLLGLIEHPVEQAELAESLQYMTDDYPSDD